MNIGIIGATGKLGGLLVTKFMEKDFITTAIVRDKTKMEFNVPTIVKDLYELTSEDIEGFDIIVNTFNAPINQPEQFVSSMQHLISIFQNAKTCLMVAGGAGILLVGEKTLLVDTPELPIEFRPIAKAEVEAFRLLEKEKSFDWMYITPPALMSPSLPYKGKHYFSGNKLGMNTNGHSEISYEDYADAFVEKVVIPQNHQIIGVYS